jgi:DNA-binding NtrC family response regulator
MTATVFDLSAITALVVEPEQAERVFLASTLTAAGLIVTASDDYANGRAALVRRPPSVLITEIRLGTHNGLHLALFGRWLRPQMIQVVTSSYSDPVLKRDAEEMGAVFVQKPFTPGGLLALLRDIGASQLRRHDDEHRER